MGRCQRTLLVTVAVLLEGCGGSGQTAQSDGGLDGSSSTDAGAADVAPDVCQGPVCGGSCCSPYQTGCGIAVETGQLFCCDTQQNVICTGSSACCSKQTSQCVNGVCCPQDAGCD